MKQAKRFNKGKPQYSLFEMSTLEPCIKVLEFGAEKYGRCNWKKGLPTLHLLDSLLRHIIAYKEGEDKDKESGINHLGHIMCNVMFLTYFHNTKWDNRKENNIE